MGGIFLLKLNIGERPIAKKYREGKMKRTLKRELKVLEIAKKEGISTSVVCVHIYRYSTRSCCPSLCFCRVRARHTLLASVQE